MTYKSRSIKRSRRSKAEIERLKIDICSLLRREQPMTARHLFYRLVSAGVIGKTEAEYKNTLIRLLSEMRRAGEMPFEWLVDSTRWIRKPDSYSSLQAALDNCQMTYRRALWDSQPAYAEVWCEKDAIASILYQETAEFDVPLMVCRGFSSLSFIHNAAETIRQKNKPAHILYFGDFDPSGLSISQTLERDLKEFSRGAEIIFRRLAVTREQITEWNLPTRPTKTTDSRAKNFEGESVEVDAIAGVQLRELCRDAIFDLIEPAAFDAVRVAEDSERYSLRIFTEYAMGEDT